LYFLCVLHCDIHLNCFQEVVVEDTVETKEEIKMEIDDPSPIPPEVEDLSKSKVRLIIFITNLLYNMSLDNKEVLNYLDFSTVNKRERQ